MWWEVSIFVPLHLKDIVSGILFDEKTSGIIEAKHNLSFPGTILLQAYFESNDFDKLFKIIKKRVLNLSQRHKKNAPAIIIEKKKIKREDWGCNWRKHFKPVNVGRTLVISPPWIKHSDRSKRINIAIYPGMAFGTGTHESTRLCLRMIEYIILKKEKTICDSFLDIGTGSGVLCISAYRLGFEKCRGIDIDKDALQNARHNLGLNGIKKGVSFTKGSPEIIKGETYSFVAANIVLSGLTSVSSSFPKLVKTGGLLAISGILKEQDKEFLNFDSVRRYFRKEKTFREGEWRGLLLRRI